MSPFKLDLTQQSCHFTFHSRLFTLFTLTCKPSQAHATALTGLHHPDELTDVQN